jgi:hypothetical protein
MDYKIIAIIAGHYVLVNIAPAIISTSFSCLSSYVWNNFIWTQNKEPSFDNLIIQKKEEDIIVIDVLNCSEYKAKHMIIVEY